MTNYDILNFIPKSLKRALKRHHFILILSSLKKASKKFTRKHWRQKFFACSTVRRKALLFLHFHVGIIFSRNFLTLKSDFCKKLLLGQVGTCCLVRMKNGQRKTYNINKKNVFSYVNVS